MWRVARFLSRGEVNASLLLLLVVLGWWSIDTIRDARAERERLEIELQLEQERADQAEADAAALRESQLAAEANARLAREAAEAARASVERERERAEALQARIDALPAGDAETAEPLRGVLEEIFDQ